MIERLQAVAAIAIGLLVIVAITPTLLAGATEIQAGARVVVIGAMVLTFVAVGYQLGRADRK